MVIGMINVIFSTKPHRWSNETRIFRGSLMRTGKSRACRFKEILPAPQAKQKSHRFYGDEEMEKVRNRPIGVFRGIFLG